MKYEVITNNKMLVGSIDRYFEYVLTEFSLIEGEIYLVDENSALHDNADGYHLLQRVRTLIDAKKIVIVFSVSGRESLKKENKLFSGFMSHANVGYVGALDLKSLPKIYDELTNDGKKNDVVGIEFFNLEQFESKMSSLRHGMDYRLKDPTSREKWLQVARELGFTGNDDEVITAVTAWKAETAGRFAGKYFDGIFVDAFETLFNTDWELVESVKTAVENISKTTNEYIYIISDSDRSELVKVLEKYSINWKLLSKYDLRGSTLGTVIDNLNSDEFIKTYSINFQNFINVKELIK